MSGAAAERPPAPAPAAERAEAAAALGRLRRHDAALYQLFVHQQLLGAKALLATAGLVLSRRLPPAQPSSGSFVSAR